LADGELTPSGTSGKPIVLDHLALLPADGSQGLRFEGSVADPLARRLHRGGGWIDDSSASAAADDSSAPAAE
jgi:hypothetical protein